MNNRPLVSIVVLTYNSSEYVLETLNSAYRQTYQGELELIITDDCSKDNTVELCREWLQAHGSRFVRTELITVEENTGISANYNRGINVSKGEWIKGIAGDDILLVNCIEDNVNFINDNSDVNCVTSAYVVMAPNNEYVQNMPKYFTDNWGTTNDLQYRLFRLRGEFFFSPSLMLSKKLLMAVGGMDERIPMLEDSPLFVNIMINGFVIHYLPIPTVKYRVGESITRQHNIHISKSLHKSRALYYKYYHKYMVCDFMDIFGYSYELKIQNIKNGIILHCLGNYKHTLITKFTIRCFNLLLPTWWRFVVNSIYGKVKYK